MDPQRHVLVWDRAKVDRFWAWQGEPQRAGSYFGRQVAPAIARLLRRLAPGAARTLDFGCGPGWLLEHLLAQGIACEGADASRAAVDQANLRLAGRPGWGGALVATGGALPCADGTFDLIICLETIEHLLPDELPGALAELRRLLKPGTGRLLMSTPNAEPLERSLAFCADCGAEFHAMQHLRAFDRAALQALLAAHGLAGTWCAAVDLLHVQEPWRRNPLNWSCAYLARRLWRSALALADRLGLPGAPPGGRWLASFTGEAQPHLLWFGGRADDAGGPPGG